MANFYVFSFILDSAVMPDVRLLSQQHNLTLYQAFCAMKYATYALCVKAHRGSNCRDCANYFVTELPNEPLERNEFPSQPLYPGLVEPVTKFCAAFYSLCR